MELTEKQDDVIIAYNKKLLDIVGVEVYQGMFNTVLGSADNIFKYIVMQKDIANLPVDVRYSMLQIAQIMLALKGVLTGEEVKVGGFFPTDEDTAWKSEQDFEKRLILLVKLLHKNLKEEGKL